MASSSAASTDKSFMAYPRSVSPDQQTAVYPELELELEHLV